MAQKWSRKYNLSSWIYLLVRQLWVFLFHGGTAMTNIFSCLVFFIYSIKVKCSKHLIVCLAHLTLARNTVSWWRALIQQHEYSLFEIAIPVCSKAYCLNEKKVETMQNSEFWPCCIYLLEKWWNRSPRKQYMFARKRLFPVTFGLSAMGTSYTPGNTISCFTKLTWFQLIW